MSGFRLSPEAESQLDSIWLYIAAKAAASIPQTALLTNHRPVLALAQHPYIGRRRYDLRAGLRSFPAGDYVIIHSVEDDEAVAILYVFHGSQDIEHFFQL